MEDARANEQAADFVRQEKILKLISNELTKNTTRVVEMAVKNEVQNSVLPSLETITKNEVKAALGTQIARGVTDSIKQVIYSLGIRGVVTTDNSFLIEHPCRDRTCPLATGSFCADRENLHVQHHPLDRATNQRSRVQDPASRVRSTAPRSYSGDAQ